MRLLIHEGDRQLFDYSPSAECILLPLGKSERAAVFKILSDALAVLAGVTPKRSSGATADVQDQSNLQNLQCFDDRKSGVVLRPATLQGAEVAPSTRDTDCRDGSDY
jgi:hypothetical protein